MKVKTDRPNLLLRWLRERKKERKREEEEKNPSPNTACVIISAVSAEDAVKDLDLPPGINIYQLIHTHEPATAAAIEL